MVVAIKLLKRGTDTQTALARFRAERQILARLQHSNIARLLDGGATESGLPYFVMEYVDGKPLLDYAAALPLRRRLELFCDVCRTVQYAHDNLIVHRDIKPSNILVTAEGLPKLLDFGIAKLMYPSVDGFTATLTAAGGPILTPGYASPEQVRGEQVTIATDIYSLGTVLYELLTGRAAHVLQNYSLAEIQREVCTRQPEKPSALADNLDPDLDNIVLMALRKEPERRYPSAAQFCDDLERYLRDLPVQARGESVLYRGRKFVKRNRAIITAAVGGAIVAVTLIMGVRPFVPSPPAARKSVSADRKQMAADRWDHLIIEPIANIGDPAPGGGSFSKSFEPWALNGRGEITFAADLSTGGQGVFLATNGTERGLSLIARAGQTAPGGGTLEEGPLGYTSMNNAGDVVFSFGLKPFLPAELRGFGRAGLYHYAHADRSLRALVIPGATAVADIGVLQSTGMHATVNGAGSVVFTGIVRTTSGSSPSSGLGAAIFLADRNGRVTKIVAPGDPAPGGARFDFAENPWINDAGDIAFGGHVTGDECINIAAIGPACAESVFLKRATSVSVESIAHQGEQVPGGSLLRWAWGPLLNNRGDLVFMGEVAPPPGLGTARGIYIFSRGATMPVAFPGDVMSDGRSVKTVNPAGGTGNYSLNNLGEVGFNASLANGDSGLYVWSEGMLHLVAGTGTVIPHVGTVSSVVNFAVNGGMLNDRGQVLFGATMLSGRKTLLVATPGSPERAKR
jgi:hypothetical protein